MAPDMYMLDLAQNYVYMRLRIVRPDGAGITAAADTVGPINLLSKKFFKQVKVYLNGKLVSDSSDKYAYQDHLSKLN